MMRRLCCQLPTQSVSHSLQITSSNISHTFTIVLLLELTAYISAVQFASHVSVNTPTRSISHGVGDPLPLLKKLRRPPTVNPFKARLSRLMGYPHIKPDVPFANEDHFRGNSPGSTLWNFNNNNIDLAIPVLPPSPYRVDSPDPESLWPQGLFFPPIRPMFGEASRRNDVSKEANEIDPYLLEGSEAIAAVTRARNHGIYYFHDIPHVDSLLANQRLRIKNNLKPHRLGSIRRTWPFNRP